MAKKIIDDGPILTAPGGQPTLDTDSVSNITSTTVDCGGNTIVWKYPTYSKISEGLVWSESNFSPTVYNSPYMEVGTILDNFTLTITGLTPNTFYYVAAFARNTSTTQYGMVHLLVLRLLHHLWILEQGYQPIFQHKLLR